jgi:hypothetical protein
MEYYNKKRRRYPYKQYSIIQGGDGGMEYAMYFNFEKEL